MSANYFDPAESDDELDAGQVPEGTEPTPGYLVGVEETLDRLARRPWPSTPIGSSGSVSFEYFPAAGPEAAARLDDCAARLDQVGPSYVSVTYGAGGSSQDRTFDAIARLQAQARSPVAGHLTTVNATKKQTKAAIDRYLGMGVRHIVALRGDPVPDAAVAPSAGFETAADLVAAIRNRAPQHTDDHVTISVAAYPEVHPKAASSEADLANLKAKFEAGADQAITQFFYNNRRFVEFLAECRGVGISRPIVAGIMPVTSFAGVSRFAGRCGTEIPQWMHDLYRGLDDVPDVRQLVSATLAAEQCRQLAELGVQRFHFYTMNRPELALAVCRILGLGTDVNPSTQRQAS